MVVDYFEHHLGPTPSGLVHQVRFLSILEDGYWKMGFFFFFFCGGFGMEWLEVLALMTVNELYCG